MEKFNTSVKKFLFAIVLVVLLLPFLQHQFHFYESKPLEGYSEAVEKMWFSSDGWWSGEYQEATSDWLNENFGFRPELVRIYNQIAYSLYNDAKSSGTIIGKDEYLYELDYITSYNGEDYLGGAAWNERVIQLKQLQDSLATRKVTLLICLAPGKASFYPEYIPDEYGKGSDSTNYKMLSQLLRENNINHIDYNKWFMEMKGATQYPLYPKTGIHWSRYGSLMAIDSLIKYVEHKRNVNMPNVIWERTLPGDTLRSPDDDIGRALNVYFPPSTLQMGYPEFHYEDRAGKDSVSMMVISDSFFWSLFDVNLAPESFTDIAFYYYNAQIYRSSQQGMTVADIETCMRDAESSDVIVLMATECTVARIGWGFTDEAYDHFVLNQLGPLISLIAKYEAIIRADEKWKSDVQKKADAQGKTLDEMIYLDAKFMAEEELKANQK